MTAWITAAFGAIKEAFRYFTGRSEAKNAPDVKAAVAAQEEVKKVEEVRAAIAEQDAETIRKEISQ